MRSLQAIYKPLGLRASKKEPPISKETPVQSLWLLALPMAPLNFGGQTGLYEG